MKIQKAIENVKHPLHLTRCSHTNREQHFRHQELCMEDLREERDHVQGAFSFRTVHRDTSAAD